ncbi:MAG: glycosyltransferase family 2 protein [bacterium]
MADREKTSASEAYIVDDSVLAEELLRDPITSGRSHIFEDPPLVSVVILNYNGRAFIRRCLETVLQNDYPNKEIILVDNASQDNSLQMARLYANRIHIVANRKNYGFAQGCNEGIKRSQGSIIILLNVDTCVRPGWIEELVYAMLKDPAIGIAGSKLLFLNGSTIQHAGGEIAANCMSFHIGYGERDRGQYDEPKEVAYVTGASVAIRREVLDAVGLIDKGFSLYYDDLDLALAARRLGYKVVYVPSSVVLHFETYGTERNSKKYYYRYHRGRIRFLLKNYGARYIFKTFLAAEWEWYHMTNFRDQLFPLLAAYLVNLPKAPYFLVRGFITRRLKKAAVKRN